MESKPTQAESIKVACRCGKRFGFPKTHLGRALTCPACGASLRAVAHGDGTDARNARAVLVILEGPRRTDELIFLAGRGPIDVGKRPDTDLVLPGSRVSRLHCRIARTVDGWRAEDCQSTNGLYVNGERVDHRDLEDGDVIRVGEYHLRYTALARGQQPPTTKTLTTKPTAPADEQQRDDPFTDPQGPPLGDLAGADEPNASPFSRLAAQEDDAEAVITMAEPEPITQTENGDEEEEEDERPICPGCQKELKPKAKICTDCGIDVRTGRSLITSQDTHLNTIYATSESIISIVSWIFWIGVYPIASEAFGTHKPHTIRAIALVTVLTSLTFLGYSCHPSTDMSRLKNYMLWAGDDDPEPDTLLYFYLATNYGDSAAFFENVKQLEQADVSDAELDELLVDPNEPGRSRPATSSLSRNEKVCLLAHRSLPPEKQYPGTYQPSQLVTHAFLHGGILHLVGNMIFLMVLGSRVNALIGNVLTLVIYPLLAVGAALVQIAFWGDQPPTPMVGASGAIMGLAGMYLVFFPVNDVHMAAWIRWGLIGGFSLSLKMWSVRGFWVVLFYIGFDAAYTLLGVEDEVARWAHLGGFGVGMALALFLLVTRLVNTRGGDLLSALLGRHAWALVGRPRPDPGPLQRLP